MNNKGAALVTVIVVVAFLSIIGTIILYASGTNFYMKTTDMKTKENFYDGERGFEEFKGLLMKDVNTAFENGYYQAMITYANAGNGDTREATFASTFFDDFANLFRANRDNYKSNLEAKYAGSNVTLTFTNPDFQKETGSERRILHGVEYSYTDPATGYNTVISTDIVLIAPELDWSVSKSEGAYVAGEDATFLPSNDPDARFKLTKYLYFENWTKK